ncbi:glycosyltransferase [Terracidiphilus gabretensis]|jgi:glycosyltransferase involved in cell wall biosynthesis|uniref:glycosyltransferase n=1 Tax=Terracidiphilus gabretensis TaxID=1577687 RepID=UPI00071BA390|nr:glycosyltransferase [Terracidiphilus gabretensis]
MKHIAFLLPTLNRNGGAERQVVLLATGLAARGWRVTIVALSGTCGEACGELHTAGVEFLSLHMRKGLADPQGWIRLNAWLKQARPEILHAHLPHAAWLARWSRLAAPVRVVVDTIHTAGTGTRGRKLGYRLSNWLTDQVTAVSEGAAQAWTSARMVSAKRLEIQPNGINSEMWKPDATVRAELRAELGLRDEFLWLAAGRLETVKNFPALLKAMAALPQHARLVIAGSGSQAESLWAQARSLGVESSVRFPGHQSNLLRWMQAADGFVLSSHWEGLPMSLLEAGACGLPCVSTAVAGATEIVLDGHTGLLVPAGDQNELNEAMRRLMAMGASERLAMGNAARQSILARYSIHSVLDHWEDLYARLLDEHPVATRWSRPTVRNGLAVFTPAIGEPASSPNGVAADAQ